MAKPPKDDIDAELDALHDEPEDAPEFNTVHVDEEAVARPAGTGRGYMLFLFLLASLLGGAIGWIGPKLNAPPDPVAELATTSRAQFSDLNTALEKKEAEIKSLRSSLDAAKRALEEERKASLSQKEALTALEGRLALLEDRSPNEEALEKTVADLTDRIAILEELKVLGAKTEDGEEAPAGILLARITALESAVKNSGVTNEELQVLKSDIETLQNKLTAAPIFPEPANEPIDLPKVENAFDREKALAVLIDTFPRDKMVEAVRAQEQLAAKKPSWLKRVMSRHVKVREDDGVDPISLIDEAEKSVRAGRVDLALDHIAKLNPPVRAVAAEWIKSAKKFQKSEI